LVIRAALSRDLVAGRDVDHIDRQVGKLRAVGRGQVVATGFDQHDIQLRKALAHLGDGRQVRRCVLSNGGVRAATGLDPNDAVRRQRPRGDQQALVFPRVDVVGDHCKLVTIPHALAEHLDQCGLARADRAAHTDAQRRCPGLDAQGRVGSH
jgi:hypothetical protein